MIAVPGLRNIRGKLIWGGLILATVPTVLITVILLSLWHGNAEEELYEVTGRTLVERREAQSLHLSRFFDEKANQLRLISDRISERKTMETLPSEFLKLSSSLKISAQERDLAISQHYGTVFSAKYARANDGAQVDTNQTITQLTENSLAAQYLYVARNTSEPKSGLLDAADNSEYSRMHANLHRLMTQFNTQLGFQDILLVDPETSYIVYSFAKRTDFGTTLSTGPWAKTGLGSAYRAALASDDAQSVFLTDFSPYRPAMDSSHAFLSIQIRSGERLQGVLIAEIPNQTINSILTYNSGWSKAGIPKEAQVYLLGQDVKLRSRWRQADENLPSFINSLTGLLPESDIELMRGRGSAIGVLSGDPEIGRRALAGESGLTTYRNLWKQEMLAAYAPFEVLGQKMAIVSETNIAESEALATTMRNRSVLAAALVWLLLVTASIFVALQFASSIQEPLRTIKKTLGFANDGDLQARNLLSGNDEIAQIGSAIDQFMDERVSQLANTQRKYRDLVKSIDQLTSSVNQLSAGKLQTPIFIARDESASVAASIQVLAESISTALRNANTIASSVADSANQLTHRADLIFSLAHQAETQASSASQELTASAVALRSVSLHAHTADKKAANALKLTDNVLAAIGSTVYGVSIARDRVKETERRIKRLAERSQEISTVIHVIGTIAEKTSVLALNASMQAIAAGEAGRGFALVADEVKRLAESAREATEQVSGLMAVIHADGLDTAHAMDATVVHFTEIAGLADSASAQIIETRQAAESLATAVDSIQTTALEQSELSGNLLERATDLVGASKRTIEEIELQRREAERLTQASQRLLAAIAQFDLVARSDDDHNN